MVSSSVFSSGTSSAIRQPRVGISSLEFVGAIFVGHGCPHCRDQFGKSSVRWQWRTPRSEQPLFVLKCRRFGGSNACIIARGAFVGLPVCCFQMVRSIFFRQHNFSQPSVRHRGVAVWKADVVRGVNGSVFERKTKFDQATRGRDIAFGVRELNFPRPWLPNLFRSIRTI